MTKIWGGLGVGVREIEKNNSNYITAHLRLLCPKVFFCLNKLNLFLFMTQSLSFCVGNSYHCRLTSHKLYFFYVKNQTQPDMQLSCNEQCLEKLSENSVCVTGCPARPDARLGAYGVHGPSARAGSATWREEHIRSLAGGRQHRPSLDALCPHRLDTHTHRNTQACPRLIKVLLNSKIEKRSEGKKTANWCDATEKSKKQEETFHHLFCGKHEIIKWNKK